MIKIQNHAKEKLQAGGLSLGVGFTLSAAGVRDYVVVAAAAPRQKQKLRLRGRATPCFART